MRLRKLDALLLTILVLARLRIDVLAEAAVLPFRQQDVAAHPFLGTLLPPKRLSLLAQQQMADPIALLLIVLAVTALITYLLISYIPTRSSAGIHRTKVALICFIILVTVVAPAFKMILLRQQSGLASYAHDGGVIQTEATIDFLLQGRNPYSEDYLDTPMAEWGLSEFRTALYHYPYLPWTFLLSAPFRLLSQATLGWYDQRFVYLLLYVLMLVLSSTLVRKREIQTLLLMTLGLNPIMGSDIIYGQNDSFVLFWIVLSLWLLLRRHNTFERRNTAAWRLGSAAAFGLACASKPTAWFFAPFYALLLIGSPSDTGTSNNQPWWRLLLTRGWPAAVTFLLVVLPYVIWDASAMIDDVWLWSSGRGEHAYQIWGWGASNLLLAFGAVESRFEYWPFWVVQLIVCLPLSVWLLRRQWRQNHWSAACTGYALLLLIFFFLSRFLNENYLGYILAFLALGVFGLEPSREDRT